MNVSDGSQFFKGKKVLMRTLCLGKHPDTGTVKLIFEIFRTSLEILKNSSAHLQNDVHSQDNILLFIKD